MTRTYTSFAELTDDQLLVEVKRLAASERRATAALIRSLMELDARRLYLGEGCSSLFTYCTRVLHLAEGAAYNRIETARAARGFPVIIPALEDGSLTMTAVRLLSPHLTSENHHHVLASARYKSKSEIERLVASLQPKPAVPSAVRRLSGPRPASNAADLLGTVGSNIPLPTPTSSQRPTMPAPRPTLKPLAPERFKLQMTILRETHDKLRRVQDLVRHTLPSADPAEIFDRALTLLLADLERRRCATTSSPRGARGADGRSRHIPAAVKREVWRRDNGQCAFVGKTGRCTERAFLEFHHVWPFAAGGPATTANIQMRCRAHNAHEASLFFGNDDALFVRETRAPYAPLA